MSLTHTHLFFASQKKEIAYIEKVLGLEIHHKLDIYQFRNKMYEKPKVGSFMSHMRACARGSVCV